MNGRLEQRDVVERIKRFIADEGLGHNQKLPPERNFCGRLGVSRVDLRKALASMEADGLIWRHVGRGTFIGSRPVHNLDDLDFLRRLANPAQMMDARLAIEPELARLAARDGTQANFDEIRRFSLCCREAQEWRTYEAWDNKFHHAVAKATHNKVLLYLFDTFNVVRRTVVWEQVRRTARPTADHFSFGQHDAIHEAIANRDEAAATERMREHLHAVAARVLAAMPPDDQIKTPSCARSRE